CRDLTRQHVGAVLPGTARSDAGLLLQVVDPGRDSQPSRSTAAHRLEPLALQPLEGVCLLDTGQRRRVIVEEDVSPPGRSGILEVGHDKLLEETLRGLRGLPSLTSA